MWILLSYRQNTATQITDHIHEWHRRRSLWKIQLDDKIFLNWFLKTLLPLLPRMLHPSAHKLRKKQSSKHNSSTLSMSNQVTFTPSCLMLLVLAPYDVIHRGHPMLLMESLDPSQSTLTCTNPLLWCHLTSVTPLVFPNLDTPLNFHA